MEGKPLKRLVAAAGRDGLYYSMEGKMMPFDKRLIFTVTTGRSGTKYLSEILKQNKRLDVFHEPEPSFQSVFRIALRDRIVARDFMTNQKLPFIKKCKNVSC